MSTPRDMQDVMTMVRAAQRGLAKINHRRFKPNSRRMYQHVCILADAVAELAEVVEQKLAPASMPKGGVN